MENTSGKQHILALAIFIGLAALGYFIFKGLKTFSDKDHVVTVKGLAEMNVTATASTMHANFSFSGDNLQDLISQTATKKSAVIAYLNSIGYAAADIKVNNINITDKEKYYENEYLDGHQVKVKVDRYSTSQSIAIKAKDVKTTEDKAAQIKLDLVSKELTCNVSTDYIFPELNSIKPKLIAESTENARVAGEQFANDSQAKLGKIKTASQGQISIAGNYDEESGDVVEAPKEPYIQKARVVSTIVFFLE
jgi:uncharacterized protein